MDWITYETEKKIIKAKNLSADEYERAIRELYEKCERKKPSDFMGGAVYNGGGGDLPCPLNETVTGEVCL